MLTIVVSSLSIEGFSGKCAGEDETANAQWTFCASHAKDSSESPEEWQGECLIPSNINEGFISHGRDNRWSLVPFSNYGGTDLKILCNDAFGDIYPDDGTEPDQYCCYSNIENMNNQFGKLYFSTSNKLVYDQDRMFINEAVIESFKLTTNVIKIGSHLYTLVSGNQLTVENTNKMTAGQALISPNKQFAGVIESDGELSVYRILDNHKLWSAPGSSGSGNNNYLEYKSDGDLVLKRSDGSEVWSIPEGNKDSNTGTVRMYDDSNLAVRNSGNIHVWGCLNEAGVSYTWSNAPAIVRYGTNDKFTYRAYTNSKLKCHHDVGFGNIIKSVNEPEKECQWTYDNTASGNPSSDIGHYTDWVPCGFDGSDCTGLTNNVPQWIRFGGGDDGNWEYQLVLTKDNRVYCNAAVFNYWDFEGLTHHVQGKRCERAKSPQYEFYDIIGAWVLIASCSNTNCGGLQYTLKYGVTLTNEHELTQEWGISLTRTASMDYKMFGGSQSITMSYNVAQRTLTSEVFTTEKEISVSCQSGQNFMWQWVTTAKEFIATSTQDITIKSKNYLCRTSSSQPTCAPGSCS